MAELLDYKCPCCGGGIQFDSSIQKMKCPYCDTEFDMETLQSYDAQLQQDHGDDISWEHSSQEFSQEETNGLVTYSCQSCGAEIVAEATLAASRCPYCDNPIVMVGQFSGDLKPDCIIPFQLDKEKAKAQYWKHLEKKPFLPKVFKDQNHIDEIKGVYVPFWLFDSDVDASLRFKTTKVKRWEDQQFSYTETSYYSVTCDGTIAFDRIPVDGSKKMPDDLMESVEPFEAAGEKTFQTAFLAGYLADRYDVTAEETQDRANERLKQSTIDEFTKTVTGYDSVKLEKCNIRQYNGRVQYALYPTWLLNTTWNDQKFTFAMNGQTGKFVGNLPCDKKAATTFTAILTVILTAIVLAGFYFFTNHAGNQFSWGMYGLISLAIGFLVALLVMLVRKSRLTSVAMQRAASSYIRPHSFKLRHQQELFLYRRLNKVQKSKNQNNPPR